MKIYLAGPINGCTDAEANDWRSEIKRQLPHHEYLDPMARDYRGREDQTVVEVVEGDKRDILNSDVVIAYTPKPSVGTSMEILWAWSLRKPVYTVCPGTVSPWLRYHSKAVYSSIPELLAAVRWEGL